MPDCLMHGQSLVVEDGPNCGVLRYLVEDQKNTSPVVYIAALLPTP